MRWERVETPRTKSVRVRGLTLDTGRDRTAVLQNGCNICHFIAARGILLGVKYFVVRVGCRLMEGDSEQGTRQQVIEVKEYQPSNFTCIGLVCETPGCVAHIKSTVSISGPL